MKKVPTPEWGRHLNCVSSSRRSGNNRQASSSARDLSREVVSSPRQGLTYPQSTSSALKSDSVSQRGFFRQSVRAAGRRSGTARSTRSGTARSTARTTARGTAAAASAMEFRHADLWHAELWATDAMAACERQQLLQPLLQPLQLLHSNWRSGSRRSARSGTSWSTSRSGTGRRTSRSTSRSGTRRSTGGSSARRSTSRSGTARGGGTTAVVVMEQAGLGAVHAGKGDQRGGNPNKLHCILQVHHGRGNVRNCGDSGPDTTSGGRTVQGSEFASRLFFRPSRLLDLNERALIFHSADERRST